MQNSSSVDELMDLLDKMSKNPYTVNLRNRLEKTEILIIIDCGNFNIPKSIDDTRKKRTKAAMFIHYEPSTRQIIAEYIPKGNTYLSICCNLEAKSQYRKHLLSDLIVSGDSLDMDPNIEDELLTSIELLKDSFENFTEEELVLQTTKSTRMDLCNILYIPLDKSLSPVKNCNFNGTHLTKQDLRNYRQHIIDSEYIHEDFINNGFEVLDGRQFYNLK